MPHDLFVNALETYKIDIDKFIRMCNKYFLMKMINKTSDDTEFNEILKKLAKFYNIESASLCILKIYEIQILRELEKELI